MTTPRKSSFISANEFETIYVEFKITVFDVCFFFFGIPIMSNLQISFQTLSSSSLFLRLQMFMWAILRQFGE